MNLNDSPLIERDIPIPPPDRKQKWKKPRPKPISRWTAWLKQLKVGDTFAVHYPEGHTVSKHLDELQIMHEKRKWGQCSWRFWITDQPWKPEKENYINIGAGI